MNVVLSATLHSPLLLKKLNQFAKFPLLNVVKTIFVNSLKGGHFLYYMRQGKVIEVQSESLPL